MLVCLSVCVCLSASISLEPLDQSSQNVLRRSPVAMARCSSGGFAVRYVLPILWMTSHLAIVGRMAMRGKRLCDTGAELDVYECLVRTGNC